MKRLQIPSAAHLPPATKPKRVDIIAAQKIIADISSGVYRSPAAAIKELISNAYDADATRIQISTDVPKFRTLTVTDDGSGMDIEQFLDVMSHIGGSRKRISSDSSPVHKRKLIGRIGIGLLAVAQLGTKFYVSSKVRGRKTRFIAEVNLDPFHKDETALLSMRGLGEDKVQIGAIQYVDKIPEEQSLHYTVISVPDAKKGLTSEITGLVRKAVGATDVLNASARRAKSFDEIVAIVSSSNRADLVLDGYHYMLWELGLLSPVRYLDQGPFDPKVRQVENLELLKIGQPVNFSVIVDGIDVRRPQIFPNPICANYPSPDPKLYRLEYDELISERKLKFYGYVYGQQPRIQPEELKGLHIRIRDVGIGKYDKSWLGYPFDEGIKFGQVSGEIFVDQGLESALNIDRDSFRETDVHYQTIKAYIWNRLRNEVFPEFKSRQKAYKSKRLQKEQKQLEKQFAAALDELPAPVTEDAVFEQRPDRSMLTALRESKAALHIDKATWVALVDEFELSKEAQDRLQRVLRVLVSSELTTETTEEDFKALLRALAIAVR
jgi:hypothetical protein